MKKLKNFPVHPFLFAVFNVFYYFTGFNLANEKWDLIIACLLTLLGTSLVWWISYHITKKVFRSAIIASLVTLASLHLDGIFEFIVAIKWMPHFINVFLTTLMGQFVLYGTLLMIAILVSSLCKKKVSKLASFFLDIVALSLTVYMILVVTLNLNPYKNQFAEDSQSISWNQYSSDFLRDIKPTKSFDGDIYYLVFDAYGSQTTLDKIYGYSGIDLQKELTERGFKVIEDGRTNYNQTIYSIPSSLNFSYIQQFSSVSPTKDSLTTTLIHDGLLFHFLEGKGYKIVTFSTGLNFLEIKTSDYYYAPTGLPSRLASELVNNSCLSLFYWKQQYLWNNQRIQYTINKLGDVSEIDKPIFVYAHILIPHPPFVYQSDGQMKIPYKKFDYRDNDAFTRLDSREAYIEGYRNQVEYAAVQIVEIITEIQKKSPNAIIIIQGDHGPGVFYEQENLENSDLDEKAHILNAYYFPDGDYSNIPENITPVNSFRVVLNQFFGTDLEILPNITYFSTYYEPMNFIDVSLRLR